MAQNFNRLFASKNWDAGNPNDFHSSHVRYNRDYLISLDTAKELNTYISFNPFPTFNEVYAPKYKHMANDWVMDCKGPGTPGVRSLFNKHGAVVVGTGNPSPNSVTTEGIIYGEASEWRVSNNVPLMDNPATRRAIRKHSGCTVKELVYASRAGLLGRETYDFSDFMYCKYLGKISNNYLITLRRFPIPCDDYISTLGSSNSSRRNKHIASQNSQSIGCMVTWLGAPGNEMQNILKYSIKMPFQWKDSEWNQVSGGGGDSSNGIANGIAGMFDSTYRKQYMAGQAGTSANVVMGKFFNVGDPPYSGDFGHRDGNKVYGPVDTIKGTYMRSEKGLENEHKMTLTFDYELRSYNMINPRQAMLDLLSNIFNVTYSTGTFWGGGYVGGGAHQNNMFANMNIFKVNGGFTDYVDAFAKDYENATEAFRNKLNNDFGGDWMSMLKSALNQLGGMIIGGALNKLGRPAKAYANSLLSPAPVGFWHVTIGNPHHPIVSMGNMIVTNVTIEHYGPLGLDDFPTGLKVVVELDRGKPRDIRDLEKIYMHGNDRIYSSMSQKIFKMYENAREYRDNSGTLADVSLPADIDEKGQFKNEQQLLDKALEEMNVVVGADPNLAAKIEIQDPSRMAKVLQKYFGQIDTYSIYFSACEQEEGAARKKKEKPDLTITQKSSGEEDGVWQD